MFQYLNCPCQNNSDLKIDNQHIPEIRCMSCGYVVQKGVFCPLLYFILDKPRVNQMLY